MTGRITQPRPTPPADFAKPATVAYDVEWSDDRVRSAGTLLSRTLPPVLEGNRVFELVRRVDVEPVDEHRPDLSAIRDPLVREVFEAYEREPTGHYLRMRNVAELLRTARRDATLEIAPDVAQIIYALERAEARLRADADALFKRHDYSAEFPAEDADRMREAIALLKGRGPIAQSSDCTACGGTREIYTHSADCSDDLCALNGDVHSCSGVVEACGSCQPAPLPAVAQVKQPRVDDLAALVRQLVRAHGKAVPRNNLCSRAMDYLKRHGLLGSPLRISTPPR